MPEELTDIEAAEIEAAEIKAAELKKLMTEVEKLMPEVNKTEVEKWAKLSVATDEQVAELAMETRRERKAARDARWESLGKEK